MTLKDVDGNMQYREPKYVLPAASVATPKGEIGVSAPRAGVGGGAPPAYVEITYC